MPLICLGLLRFTSNGGDPGPREGQAGSVSLGAMQRFLTLVFAASPVRLNAIQQYLKCVGPFVGELAVDLEMELRSI